MKAIDLSLATKLYRVSVDAIEEVCIECLIMNPKRDTMLIAFPEAKERYNVPVSATNICKLYYFTNEEAVQAQHDMRLDALQKCDKALRKKAEEYKKLKDKYGKES